MSAADVPVPAELLSALVAEAARKSGICWLSYDASGSRVVGRMAWHAWYVDALVVLAGEPEQRLEGIERATAVEVTMRSKETRAHLVTWTGSVSVVDPEDEQWEAYAGALVGVRLNLPDPAAAVVRWRESRTVVRITPGS